MDKKNSGCGEFSIGMNDRNSGEVPVNNKPGISQKIEEQKRVIEEQRRSAVRAILEPSSIERLNRIALVKPDKAFQIEEYILRTARVSGFSPYKKIKEEELISMISMMNEVTENSGSKIKIYRKGIFDDDDEFNTDH
ncbi:DNA-binding protein [Cryptosporidium felis]|nr:DNA-binding protein [Cryptosporidium felis]